MEEVHISFIYISVFGLLRCFTSTILFTVNVMSNSCCIDGANIAGLFLKYPLFKKCETVVSVLLVRDEQQAAGE